MELVNRTAFPAAAFRQFDTAGALDAIIAVSGSFVIVPGGPLRMAAYQQPFQWIDEYDGDPQAIPLVRQGDLVPFKPGTDLTVLGDAHCPASSFDAGAAHWRCGLQITDAAGQVRLEKSLRVTGPREWQPSWRAKTKLFGPNERVFEGWKLSSPEPARSVPLDWRYARGGRLPDGPPKAVHTANPIGVGIIGQATARDRSWPAPQIEGWDDPVQNWQDDPAPAGLGPLSPWWRPRQQHAGTYGQDWLNTRHPLLPADFNERFWQCAPPDQVIEPWLRGTERFVLLNLHPGHPRLAGGLPGIMLGMTVNVPGETSSRVPLNLDGVHFDLREGEAKVTLTWRARVPLPEGLGARLTLAERARVAEGVDA